MRVSRMLYGESHSSKIFAHAHTHTHCCILLSGACVRCVYRNVCMSVTSILSTFRLICVAHSPLAQRADSSKSPTGHWDGVIFVHSGPFEGGIFRFRVLIAEGHPTEVTPRVFFQTTVSNAAHTFCLAHNSVPLFTSSVFVFAQESVVCVDACRYTMHSALSIACIECIGCIYCLGTCRALCAHSHMFLS